MRPPILPVALPRFRGVALAASVLPVLLGGPRPAIAQSVRDDLWVANSSVRTTLLSGNLLYIGGDFTQVGPATGCFVPVDAASGLALPGFPKVNGTVYDMQPDGSGGWFIAGSFTEVDGTPRANLAHIRSDLTLSPWNPGTDGDVNALAISGSTVYVGGSFTNVGGQARNRIAAIDAATGSVTAWDPDTDGTVYDLVVGGTTVYASGFFTTIGGQARSWLAALDATVDTNNATAWNPNANGSVDVMALSGTTLYVGGHFTNIGAHIRNYIASLDVTVDTVNATNWDPNVVGGYVNTLAVSGTTVYVGGYFSSIGGQARNCLAALQTTVNTNNATAWDPNPNTTVEVVAVNGSTVYVGGAFTTIGGQSRNNLAALDANVDTNNATAWNPSANKPPLALGFSGSTVFVGGTLTSVGGVDRHYIAALDVTTGQATAWNPGADDVVRTMALSGSTLYVGGRFTQIGGQFRLHVAALDVDTDTNNATSWAPDAGGTNVYALAVSGTTVYVGGDFTSAGGKNRNRIAALDATIDTNSATNWNPNANDVVRALVVSGTTVYAGGDFYMIGGQPRDHIAALNATLNTNNATAWVADVNDPVQCLALSGTTMYAGGDFTSVVAGPTRNRIAAFDVNASADSWTSWDPDADAPVTALLVDGSTVYAGGAFTQIGGQARNGLAALDATAPGGDASAWTADAPGGALSFSFDGSTVYAGGYFFRVAGVAQSYLAALGPIATDAPVVPDRRDLTLLSPNRPDPFGSSTRIRFSLDRPGPVSLAVYDVAGRRVATLLQERWLDRGAHEVELRGANLASGVYLCRLQTAGGVQVERMVHVR